MMKKYLPTFLILVIIFASCNGNYSDNGYDRPVYLAPGVGLGTIIAVVISWSRNKSILWAILHGIFGWFYVIYAIIVGKKN